MGIFNDLIFGKRINGPTGHSVDIAAVIGTIFGIATTLGIGVVQLNYGLSVLFDIPDSMAAKAALIALSVIIATIVSLYLFVRQPAMLLKRRAFDQSRQS